MPLEVRRPRTVGRFHVQVPDKWFTNKFLRPIRRSGTAGRAGVSWMPNRAVKRNVLPL